MRNRISFLLAFFLMAVALPASAHAVLVAATPQANATVHGNSTRVRLQFNLRIDGERSRLLLVQPDGQERPLKASQPSADLLISEQKGLSPGWYELRWLVLAEDGHISRGEFRFLVE